MKMLLSLDCLVVVCQHLDIPNIIALVGSNRYVRRLLQQIRFRIGQSMCIPQVCQVGQYWFDWSNVTCKQLVLHGPHMGIFVAWSPNGRLVASGWMNGLVYVWDMFTMIMHLIISGPFGLQHLAFSPDNTKLIVAFADQTLHVWEMRSKQLHADRMCILRGIPQRIQSIAFDVSGTKFASVYTSGTIKIWQLKGKDSGLIQTIDLQTIGHRPYGLYYRVVWPRPDCIRIGIMTTTGRLEVWDGLTRQCIFTQPQARGQLGLSHAGDKIAYATPDHEVWVCNIQTKQVEAKLIGHTQYIVQIKWSQDDSKLVTVSNDTTVRVWNMSQCQVFRDHEAVTLDAAFSPDGTKVVSISYDNTCRIWEQ